MPPDVGLSTQSAPCPTRHQRLWTIGRQTFIEGDCLAELKGLDSGSVDVIVTSPPYNIGIASRAMTTGVPATLTLIG